MEPDDAGTSSVSHYWEGIRAELVTDDDVDVLAFVKHGVLLVTGEALVSKVIRPCYF